MIIANSLRKAPKVLGFASSSATTAAASATTTTTTTTTITSLFLTLNIQISHRLQIARLIEAGGV